MFDFLLRIDIDKCLAVCRCVLYCEGNDENLLSKHWLVFESCKPYNYWQIDRLFKVFHFNINKPLTQTRHKQTDYHLEHWQPLLGRALHFASIQVEDNKDELIAFVLQCRVS